MTGQAVLAMYDVRGIQKYIFRTAKVQDAIGASAIVEDIILEALEKACETKRKAEPSLSVDLNWCTKDGTLSFKMEEKKEVQVLFVGGGNAYVIFRDRDLCREINCLMSAYVMKETYSLQLASAITECTGNYKEDYDRLHQEMNRTKADMIVSKPLGALPVMQIEVKTGYPMGIGGESTETSLKKEKYQEIIKGDKKERIFDNYVTEKGVDSTLAVVHMDGNNMGLRIKEKIQEITDYDKAIGQIREISYQINHSFKQVFDEMAEHFNKKRKEKGHYFVRKILVAGDDITYVCNGAIALASIEYFCKKITKLTMTGEADDDSVKEYGFSVCAGAAFIHSHFPFSIGYEVAEECCDSAKKRAKDERYMDNGRIGCFVDFHICKNVHAQNLKLMRLREYQIGDNYTLLTRPYYISTDAEGGLEKLNKEIFAFQKFKTFAKHFCNEENMPRTFVKELRNVYAQGENQINLLIDFLESRNWKFPEGDSEAFYKSYTEKQDDAQRRAGEKKGQMTVAKWYDALEMLDYCEYLDEKEENQNETVSDQDNAEK